MKIQSIKQGFTLIELLVVITIIGILATGATTVFTSQIQKARDTTRITSIEGLKGAVEQVYQDTSEYPYSNTFLTTTNGIGNYMEVVPQDPKHGEACNNNAGSDTTMCGFMYRPADDDNGIEFGAYELSTAFENSGNVDNKAKKDNGNDNGRFEIGINIGTIVTDAVPGTATLPSTYYTGGKKGACTIDATTPAAPVAGAAGAEVLISIAGTSSGLNCTQTSV